MTWRRSSRCDTGSCVEVDLTPDRVRVRNSQAPDVVVEFDAEEWAAFVAGVEVGEFRP